jgi:dGTPase
VSPLDGVLLRDELEAREVEQLAAFAMTSRASAGRAFPESEHELRSAYQRDRERIIHSRAFRRLVYKTQVFVNHEGDYYRTRLTHTIEVSQIARTVARALRLNEDLAEAIALAHDLGHPPFGHAGERALAELMAEHGGFEHNAQALRTVDLLERRYARFRGLNLTYEVREGVWKRRDTETARALGYGATFDRARGALLEAQVADLADAIAYDHHDLDDALKSGLLRLEDLRGLALWDRALPLVQARLAEEGADRSERVLRPEMIRTLVGQQVRDLVTTTRRQLDERGVRTLADVRATTEPLVTLSAEMRQGKQELERFLFQRVYRHHRVMRQMEKARRLLRELWGELVLHPNLLPDEYREWVERVGLQRGVCDYLAGMTDRYAQREHRQLFEPLEPM